MGGQIYQSIVVEGGAHQVRNYVKMMTKFRLCGKGEACQCSMCMAISKGVSSNLREYGGQSLAVSEVRRAIQALTRKSAKFRSVLFLALSGLSDKSANSLLKVIEEPPAGTQIFIGVSTQWMLTTTILSRCTVKQLSGVCLGESYSAMVSQDLEGRLKLIRKWRAEHQLDLRICEIVQFLWEKKEYLMSYKLARMVLGSINTNCDRIELINVLRDIG